MLYFIAGILTIKAILAPLQDINHYIGYKNKCSPAALVVMVAVMFVASSAWIVSAVFAWMLILE